MIGESFAYAGVALVFLAIGFGAGILYAIVRGWTEPW